MTGDDSSPATLTFAELTVNVLIINVNVYMHNVHLLTSTKIADNKNKIQAGREHMFVIMGDHIEKYLLLRVETILSLRMRIMR